MFIRTPPINSFNASQNMKTIIVTGGCGFIGNHLCKRLLAEGNRVICVDNLITGCMDNISTLFANPNFVFVESDIENIKLPERFDQLYNLACPASPIQYKKHPMETIKSSTVGLFNLLSQVKKANARFLQASTSEIYGDPLQHPQKESYFGNVNCFGDRSCYDEGKRCAEAILFSSDVDFRIARIFNTYGPAMAVNDGRVVSNFIVNAIQNKDLEVFGSTTTRSFCYVDDTVDGLIKLMNSDYRLPMNIGNYQEMTILHLATIIKRLLHSESKINICESVKGDPHKRKPDIMKAEDILNWHPKTDLEIGLKKTIKYFKKGVKIKWKIN